MSRDKHPHHSSQTQPNTAKGTTPGSTVGQAGGQLLIVERIRLRAYEIFVARNGGPGDPSADWAQAEREINGNVGESHVNDEALCDTSTLEIKTRSQPTLATARGGL